jgi:hypothetical protein
MKGLGVRPPTRFMLSFSSAYKGLARRLKKDLGRSNIDVRYDQWEGGGGVPATRKIRSDIAGLDGLMVLLTPSDSAAIWVGAEWRRSVYGKARDLGVPILPIRGAPCTIPKFLAAKSFADLSSRGYGMELQRLVERVRELTGDDRIEWVDDADLNELDRSSAVPSATSITMEIGAGLARVFDQARLDHFVTEMVPGMKGGLFHELGVVFPDLEVRVASDLKSTSARILINEVPETVVTLHPGWVMVNDSAEAMAKRGFKARPAVNPANENPTAWIPGLDRERAAGGGLTIWDAATFLILTISALLRNKAADFIGLDETRLMIRKLELDFPHLVSEALHKIVSEFMLSDVLRRLVAEQVSIRNLRRIVLALAEWAPVESDPLYLTEYARAALQREIMHRLSRGTNQLVVLLLDPKIETMIAAATVHTPTGSYVDLPPARLRAILDAIRKAVVALGEGVQLPVILTVMEIRASVQRLVAPSLPMLRVTSYQELRPDTSIQPIGRITLRGTGHRRDFKIRSPWESENVPERRVIRANPIVPAALEKVEHLLTPLAGGRFELSPSNLQQADRLLGTFLGSRDLAALVQGLVNLAERLATKAQSEEAAKAILGLLERPQVLEPLNALVEAARHFKQHETDISLELDTQMRANAYRAHLNFGNPTVPRTPAADTRPPPAES